MKTPPRVAYLSSLIIKIGFVNMFLETRAFDILDYSHYFDYLPYRQEGLATFEVIITIILCHTFCCLDN